MDRTNARVTRGLGGPVLGRRAGGGCRRTPRKSRRPDARLLDRRRLLDRVTGTKRRRAGELAQVPSRAQSQEIREGSAHNNQSIVTCAASWISIAAWASQPTPPPKLSVALVSNVRSNDR